MGRLPDPSLKQRNELIIRYIVEDGHSLRDAAAKWGLTLSTVSRIVTLSGWYAVGRRVVWERRDPGVAAELRRRERERKAAGQRRRREEARGLPGQ